MTNNPHEPLTEQERAQAREALCGVLLARIDKATRDLAAAEQMLTDFTEDDTKLGHQNLFGLYAEIVSNTHKIGNAALGGTATRDDWRQASDRELLVARYLREQGSPLIHLPEDR